MQGIGTPLRIAVVGLAVCSLALTACSSKIEAPRPETLPYTLEQVKDERTLFTVDLDGDGQDERINYSATHRSVSGAPPERNAFVIKTLEKKTIEQVNYGATIAGELHFLDVEGDGVLEILAPIVRNDSLFLSVVDARGRKQHQFFVTRGEPRIEPDGEIPWDPEVRAAFMADVDADRQEELVLGVVTRYARMPRGVWVFSFPEGERLGHHIVGAHLGQFYHGNFDDDPEGELLFSSGASNNGGAAGGMDDRHAYLGAFELGASPHVQWAHNIGDLWKRARIREGDLDGDGTRDFLAFKTTQSGRPTPTHLQLIDPGTGAVYRQATSQQPVKDVAMVDLDRDAQDEILVLKASGELSVLDGTLRQIRRIQLDASAGRLDVLPDVDGGGADEVAVSMAEGTIFLDSDLRPKAFTEARGKRWKPVRRGAGLTPHLHVEQSGRSHLFRMAENPFYLAHRYGPWALGLLGFGLVAALGWGGATLYRRNRELRAAQVQMLDADERGTLLVEPDREIAHLNAPAHAALGMNGHPPSREYVRHCAPALVDLIDRAATEPPHRWEEQVSLGANGHTREVTVTLDPLPVRGEDAPYWLVRIDERAGEYDAEAYRAWGLMARRIAHDLKNPLTSILLTLQRMQMEYREQAPDAADTLDTYSTRIEERIEHLRRMTKNFMKFVDAEASALVRADLNDFARTQGAALQQGLPPDIRLRTKLDGEMPPVRIDPEQMQSVLENLVANAVNALPEGGTITLATHLEQDVQIAPEQEPKDYAVLEVQDTGVGMDAAVRERLFEPGFTTSKEGTGLGLAIAKKVIDDHDGHIEVESEPGSGSAFCIYLPLNT